MALSISFENSSIKLYILGCHNGNCNKLSNSCGEIEILTEQFHPYVKTPLTRLFLHIQFGQKYIIDNLIKQFQEYFDENKHFEENGIDYFKKIILENLETDESWKICSKCDTEYKNKSRTFEKINYIVPEKDLCFFHKKIVFI